MDWSSCARILFRNETLGLIIWICSITCTIDGTTSLAVTSNSNWIREMILANGCNIIKSLSLVTSLKIVPSTLLWTNMPLRDAISAIVLVSIEPNFHPKFSEIVCLTRYCRKEFFLLEEVYYNRKRIVLGIFRY